MIVDSNKQTGTECENHMEKLRTHTDKRHRVNRYQVQVKLIWGNKQGQEVKLQEMHKISKRQLCRCTLGKFTD